MKLDLSSVRLPCAVKLSNSISATILTVSRFRCPETGRWAPLHELVEKGSRPYCPWLSRPRRLGNLVTWNLQVKSNSFNPSPLFPADRLQSVLPVAPRRAHTSCSLCNERRGQIVQTISVLVIATATRPQAARPFSRPRLLLLEMKSHCGGCG
jgi:hypothetical protein